MAPRGQRREFVGVLGYCNLIYRLGAKQASNIEQEVAEQAEEEETNSLFTLVLIFMCFTADPGYGSGCELRP
jgi:hypothetical protein